MLRFLHRLVASSIPKNLCFAHWVFEIVSKTIFLGQMFDIISLPSDTFSLNFLLLSNDPFSVIYKISIFCWLFRLIASILGNLMLFSRNVEILWILLGNNFPGHLLGKVPFLLPPVGIPRHGVTNPLYLARVASWLLAGWCVVQRCIVAARRAWRHRLRQFIVRFRPPRDCFAHFHACNVHDCTWLDVLPIELPISIIDGFDGIIHWLLLFIDISTWASV